MTPRTIAILGGTGQQGGGLAQRLARAGERIIVGSRDPTRAAATVEQWRVENGSIGCADYAGAAAAADVVMLAVPFDAADALLAQCAAHFRDGALIVDVIVPVAFSSGSVELSPIAEGSASEYVKSRLPPHVHLAATFKTVPARLLNDIDRPLDCDEFVCGDSAPARESAAALVKQIAGLRPIDVGPLRSARSIEHLTLLAIRINRRHHVHDARFAVVGL